MNATPAMKHYLKVSQNFLLAANVRSKYLCFCLPFHSFPACNEALLTGNAQHMEFTDTVFPML